MIFGKTIHVIDPHTAAIEFGTVEAVEPFTTVILDTPAGLVTGCAAVKGGSVTSVSIWNVFSSIPQRYSTCPK